MFDLEKVENKESPVLEALSGIEDKLEAREILMNNLPYIAKLKAIDWENEKIEILKLELISESKLESIRKAAKGTVDEDGDWEEKLTYDEDMKVKKKLYNIDLILNNAQTQGGGYYRDLFYFDDFNQRIVIRFKDEIIEFDDTYMALLRVRLAREYGDFAPHDIEAVITTIAKNNHFHPLQEQIKSVEWDGQKRLDRWLTICAGAEDTKYNSIVGRKWAISAIARLFRSGCKVDNMIVLEGEQGVKKSTILRLLSYDNFLDGGIDIRTKDGIMSLFGKWIVEFSELEGLNGRSADQIKSFLGKQDDKIRLPYQKKEEYFKRTCVFAGTTNKKNYLNDVSGNRRFWPVKVNFCKIDKVKEIRDQLWAEAYQAFLSGEEWWINEESEEAKLFKAEQGGRLERSEVEEIIEDYEPDIIFRDGTKGIKMLELWQKGFKGRLENLNRKKEQELAHSLRLMGFEKGVKVQDSKKFKGWLKPPCTPSKPLYKGG